MGGLDSSSSSSSLWLAPNPSKRWGELFFLLYTPFWLTLCLGIIVPYKIYEMLHSEEALRSYLMLRQNSMDDIRTLAFVPVAYMCLQCSRYIHSDGLTYLNQFLVGSFQVHVYHPSQCLKNFTELEYLLLGLVSALPSFLIPLVLVGKVDRSTCWRDRYWVKASLWIVIFSYVGNYFWTHYFFTVLGASYTFPSWRMNNVPHTTFLLTHVCFLFYHVTSNMTLRRLRHYTADLQEPVQWIVEATWILALSYFIAYLETVAIANFPYYQFVDRASMYKVGCLFYAIYFMVSFPMFLRIDEKPGDPWDLPRVAVDALGAAMLVTIILDLWRIFLGPIVPLPDSKQCSQPGLPWLS